MFDPILPHRAMFLCDKKLDCSNSRACGKLCKHTTDVSHAKNGPVKDVREWETRFHLELQEIKWYYVENDDECEEM